MRVFFAFLCGFCFHVAFFIYGVRYANVATYIVCLLGFYWALDKIEEVQITRPIEVSFYDILFSCSHARLFFQKTYIFHFLVFFFQEIKAIGNQKHGDIDLATFLPAQAGQMLKMFDFFMQSGLMKKLEQAQKYFYLFTSLVQDIVLFVFATMLMDSMLIMFHKQYATSRQLPDDMEVEL